MHGGRRKRGVLSFLAAALVATALLGALPAGANGPPVLVVDGLGWGHGVGMAQDGAYWMGRSGATLEQILGHFYPGVGSGRMGGTVRVAVLDSPTREAVLTFPDGGEVRSPLQGPQRPGFPLVVPRGGAVRVRADGALSAEPVGTVSARQAGGAHVLQLPGQQQPSSTTTSTTAPTTSTTAPTTTSSTLLPSTSQPPAPPTTAAPTTSTTSPVRSTGDRLWAVPAPDGSIGVPARDARYRGVVEAVRGGAGLKLVNELDVEQYLRGMGEVRDPSWPQASLQAQAVVARTYALRAMRANGEICDTQRCQVYLGRQAEYGAMDKAVQATAGRVLTFGGALAATVYSANGGGVSATPQEGFGTPDGAYPYLTARAYETKDPKPWQVKIGLGDLAPRLDYAGALTGVRVASTGPSGRPTAVELTGEAGPKVVPAIEVQRALGLKSTRWSTRLEHGEAPPPPPEGDVLQASPDERVTTGAPARAQAAALPVRDGGPPPALLVLAAVAALAAAGAGGLRIVRRAGRSTLADEA